MSIALKDGSAAKKQAEKFYAKILKVLVENDLPILIGGTYAVKHYTGITRPTKDIDIFCKASDYPKILKTLGDAGFNTEVNDDRWLAKVAEGRYFMDIIFGSLPGLWPINDSWFEKAEKVDILGYPVCITPPEELIWSKAYRQARHYFDGPDVYHIILKKGKTLDWKKLLNMLDPHWELFFAHLINFRFVYPSERDVIPKWVLDELISRLQHQLEIPTPQDKVCRGTLLSHRQYRTAIKEWGFKDVTQFFSMDKDV